MRERELQQRLRDLWAVSPVPVPLNAIYPWLVSHFRTGEIQEFLANCVQHGWITTVDVTVPNQHSSTTYTMYKPGDAE